MRRTDHRHLPILSALCVLCEKILLPLFPALCALFLCSCRSIPPITPGPNPLIRFLITFDDGPSGKKGYNPTLSILDQLATNDVQPGICAIFFIQTHHPHGADTPTGWQTMLEVPRHGQITGIHSVSPKGHVDHTTMATNDLIVLLNDARNILKDISGIEPVFVRPPYGVSNPATRAIYRNLKLSLLMADVPAHDGVIYGFNGSPTRRRHIRQLLVSIRNRLVEHPTDVKPYPVIVAFHDVNPYTARHMTEYLHILKEEAARVGFDLPGKPFYATREETVAAAMSRIVAADKPGNSP